MLKSFPCDNFVVQSHNNLCFRGTVWTSTQRRWHVCAGTDPQHWGNCPVFMSARTVHGGQCDEDLPEEGHMERNDAYMQMW